MPTPFTIANFIFSDEDLAILNALMFASDPELLNTKLSNSAKFFLANFRN